MQDRKRETLRGLLAGPEPLSSARVQELVQSDCSPLPRVTDVDVEPVKLTNFGSLLDQTDSWYTDTGGRGCEYDGSNRRTETGIGL